MKLPRLALAFALLCILFSAGPCLAQTAPQPAPTDPPWLSPFCDVSARVVAGGASAAEPANGAAPSSYWVLLDAQSGSTVDAHVTLVGDTDAYDVAIVKTAIAGEPFKKHSNWLLVNMPKPVAIHYAYVDSYAIDTGTPMSCPSVVRHVGDLTASAGSTAIAGPAVTSNAPAAFAAAYLQALPKLPCGKVFQEATVTHPANPGGFNTGKRLSATIAVFLDSLGHPIKTYVYGPSGSDVADFRALASAQATKYSPATFLCTPVVGEYLFRVDFE